ncbi:MULTISPECIES: hypothetical protein [Aneurinibacillus]|uniref:Uncharacterized protein n=1 Tax=Aneurinibacillus thermoaerophilus TaxID=143495 RepID=A0A1G7XLE4_ANETH|nr:MULTISPECIES: hypothetical protein [Aneurinibacillus]AMA73630.1 hypothetical protein ACH33_12695 [Aneurinibacillus sp. XH2]MED0675027.1 hypothetical protein [Aneurinibacillus thermoaerophilus]MED0679571.1 hypothetical protein [Aneurinibacillus thermoaerophilus]MED0737430.1 hypothetical protein [Aneurinibacillus thermoaerophilus]MED0756279.1 hypothetical protein [Aneurinibacillus thermoaerophilus]
MKKPEQKFGYDAEGEKIVQQNVMNAYQSGVIEDGWDYSEMGDNPWHHTENAAQEEMFEDKSPDDFEE